jgi:hypothetical protein
MANKGYKESSVKGVADAIRSKMSEDTPTTTKFKIGEMGEAVRNIKSYEYYRDKFIIDNAGAIRFAKGWISDVAQDEEHPCVYEIIDNDTGIIHAFTRSIILKAALCVDPDDHTKFRITRIFFDGGNGQRLVGSTAAIVQNGVRIPHFIAEQDDAFSIHDSETYHAVYTSETAPAMVGQTSYSMSESERLFINRKIKVTGFDAEQSFSILTDLFKDGKEISLKEIFNMKFTLADIDFKWKLNGSCAYKHKTEAGGTIYYYDPPHLQSPSVEPFIIIGSSGVSFTVGCTMSCDYDGGTSYKISTEKSMPMGTNPPFYYTLTELYKLFLSKGEFIHTEDGVQYSRETEYPPEGSYSDTPIDAGPSSDEPKWVEVDTRYVYEVSDNDAYMFILYNPSSTSLAFNSNGYSTFLWNNTLQNLELKMASKFGTPLPSEVRQINSTVFENTFNGIIT